jgi:hypothetical protein
MDGQRAHCATSENGMGRMPCDSMQALELLFGLIGKLAT